MSKFSRKLAVTLTVSAALLGGVAVVQAADTTTSSSIAPGTVIDKNHKSDPLVAVSRYEDTKGNEIAQPVEGKRTGAVAIDGYKFTNNVKVEGIIYTYVYEKVAKTSSSSAKSSSTDTKSSGSDTKSSSKGDGDDASVGTVTPLYRVYNKNNGEHHYTVNETEAKVLIAIGWNDEGIAWQAPTTGDKVYRVYNPNSGDHHYTKSEGEKDALVTLGWNYEGVGFYSAKKEDGVAIYRVYNPNAKAAGSHHYTKNEGEAKALVALGWKYEGIAWYGK